MHLMALFRREMVIFGRNYSKYSNFADSTVTMDPEKYAEQMKWKQSVIEKAESKRREEEDAMNELTFKPRLETKDVEPKKMTGNVAELTIKSGNSYVERQLKARKEKQSKAEKLTWRPTNSRSKKSPMSMTRDKLMSFPGSPSNASDVKDSYDLEDDEDGVRELTYEESLVEMLEKERKYVLPLF